MADKFITVDGLRLRYIEEGDGPAVLLLHGASLGSSADVFASGAISQPLSRAAPEARQARKKPRRPCGSA